MCLFSASCRGSPLWTVGRGYVCSLENTFLLGQKASFRGFWLSVFTECNKSKIRTIMSCVFKGATNDPFAPVACSILGKYIEVIEGIGKIEVFFTSLGFHGMSFLDFVALKFVQEIHSNAKIQWSRRSPKKQKEIRPPVLFWGGLYHWYLKSPCCDNFVQPSW